MLVFYLVNYLIHTNLWLINFHRESYLWKPYSRSLLGLFAWAFKMTQRVSYTWKRGGRMRLTHLLNILYSTLGWPKDFCTLLSFIYHLGHLLIFVACLNCLANLWLEASVTSCSLLINLQRHAGVDQAPLAWDYPRHSIICAATDVFGVLSPFSIIGEAASFSGSRGGTHWKA